MYCIKCGVELADSEKKCPLCGTVVYHPDIKQGEAKTPYPPYEYTGNRVNPKGILLVMSIFFGMIALMAFIIDLKLNAKLVWSGYVIGGLAVMYVVCVLPLWFGNPNPVIFSAADFVATGLLLFYINFQTGGHWFLSLALPLTGCAALIVVGMIALVHYVKRGYLYIFGGALIADGFYIVLIELLINYTFGFEQLFLWSVYPLVSCFVIGMMMIVIAICKPLRQMLHKKFFV